MSKNLLTIEAFAEWCEKQPAEQGYDYGEPMECAAAQYFKHLGFEKIRWMGDELPDGWREALNPPLLPDEAPLTFGALAKRLRSLSA